VTYVSPKGAFVKLGDTYCDGFIPFADSGHRRGHRRSKQVFSPHEPAILPLEIGARIEVVLVNVSVSRRRVELRQLTEEETTDA
jgi:ribosomal protein S1